MTKTYTLDANNEPVVCNDFVKWSRFMATDPRRVLSQIDLGDGLIRVSTIFLGMDHRFYGRGPPLLFETMTFGADPTARLNERTSTYADAWAQHYIAVEHARKLVAASETLLRKVLLAPR